MLLVAPLALSLWPVRSVSPVKPIALRWYDLVAGLLALAMLLMFLLSRNAMVAGWPVRPVVLLPFVLYASMRLTPRSTTIEPRSCAKRTSS